MDKKISLKEYTLETERLYLRTFQKTDLMDLYDYASVDGVGECAGWQHHTDINVTSQILDEFVNNEDNFAIVYKENGKVIGSVGIIKYTQELIGYENLSIKEIGYVLSKAYWGNGLMTEAVKKVIKFAFSSLNIDMLICGHFSTNARSQRVIEKCGFQYVKDIEYYAKQVNSVIPSKQYFLFKDKYIAGNV